MSEAAAREPTDRYGLVARVLHWTMGLLLVVQVAGAIYVFEFMARSAERVALIGLHKALGVVLLVLALVRLAWRLHERPPALPATLSPRQRTLAAAGHRALYAGMIALPLLGLWVGDTGGRPTDVFGLFTVPVLLGESERWHEVAEALHKWGGWAFGALIVGHAGVALWHRARKDGVADRML